MKGVMLIVLIYCVEGVKLLLTVCFFVYISVPQLIWCGHAPLKMHDIENFLGANG